MAVDPTAERYLPYEVYKNMPELLRMRGAETTHRFLNQSKFTTEFSHFEKIVIQATRGDRKLYIFITSPGSKFATRLPEFKKMIHEVPEAEFKKGPEILIISENNLTNYIMTEIKQRRYDYKDLYIEMHDYSIFVTLPEKNVNIQHHEIVPEDELREFLQTHHRSKRDLPKIFASDTPVVWLGGRPGDVIKVLRISETVGEAPAYRIVI